MKIYVDMDGVLADFDGGLKKLCGFDPKAQKVDDAERDDMIWNAVRNVDHFYGRLEPIRGTVSLLERLYEIYGDDCQILTAIPKPERNIPYAEEDKRLWAQRLLPPGLTVNIVMRKDKTNFCTGPDCILIDDYSKNIRAWNEAGGTGILFLSPEDTERELKDLGLLTSE